MTEASTVKSHLEQRFTEKRVVFWHDADGDYINDLDSLGIDGVQIIRVAGDEFAIKNRLLEIEPKAKFLIYRQGAAPAGLDNWLLDLELAYGVFTADRASLLQQELGLTDPRVIPVLEARTKFFGASARRQALAKLLSPSDDPTTLQAKMCAALLKQSEHSLLEITRALLLEAAEWTSAKYEELTAYGLDGFYWEGVASIYGYSSATPTLPDFVLWVFRKAMDNFKADTPNSLRNIRLDFAALRYDMRSKEALATLASRAADDLDVKPKIADVNLGELIGSDLFEQIDQKIITDLARGVVEQSMTPRQVADVVRQRQSSIWIDRYRKLYTAIESASELLSTIAALPGTIDSFDTGLKRYQTEWFRIDQLYRRFTYAAKTADFQAPLTALRAEVEKFYANKYLFNFGTAWQQKVDLVSDWTSGSFRSQASFYAGYVAPLVSDGRKAVVIISDGMRYEVADELGARIRRENKFEAELSAVLGVLPSYTQLGMASLLPHSILELSPEGMPVYADGKRTDGTVNRAKVLESVHGFAVQAEELLGKTRDEVRAVLQQHQVIYVYHDRIDATGDKAATESQVFEAAEETLRVLVDLVKKMASADASNIFITADHGFQYQDTPLDETFFLSTPPQGDQITRTNRRYVLGKGLKHDPAFMTFQPAQVGLGGEIEVQIPKSIHRIKQPGAGTRYVHGGASLQEIVVPVVTVSKKKKSDVRPVNVEIVPESDKITTGQLAVRLYQVDPVSDKVQSRTVRAGIYVGETALSNIPELVFDQTSTDKRDRYQTATLYLSQEADDFNNRPVEVRLEEPIPNTNQWKVFTKAPYTLKRSFTADFDF
ncbi:BREX-1 system phosphatase PglZ type A [Arthrobacter sp. Rue61a]|uniref:BREX-1 system phosphatase PglZ type A n=1 Tax=Arthrobacter sp. Rue61a TaxID=1118963 RepID=UPI000150AE87|nr:BREX-1 system phosphatase PglZ type A [Arthrobacter sp. Rue61a]AFR34582.1 hypothetical protein ARUE_113p00740 [Arthrobacter sp. Rue61a]